MIYPRDIGGIIFLAVIIIAAIAGAGIAVWQLVVAVGLAGWIENNN